MKLTDGNGNVSLTPKSAKKEDAKKALKELKKKTPKTLDDVVARLEALEALVE